MPSFLSLSSARAVQPGFLLAALIAAASMFVSEHYGGPVMLYAILLGMAFNFLRDDEKLQPGVQFAARRVLQAGVILLGAAVTAAEISTLGLATIALVVVAVASTVLIGYAIARIGGLDRPHAILSAGAVAICGASAALAIASVLPKRETSERQLILTVVGVTTLSTIAMIIYPSITTYLGFSDLRAGLFLGATIHDVAQVLGAGYIISDDAASVAAVVKLMRVTLLAPVVLIVSFAFSRASRAPGVEATGRAFPLFLIGFGVVLAANSVGLIPDPVRGVMQNASRFCLVVAVAALGVKTSLKELVGVGPRPIIVMTLQTLFLAAFVGAATLALSDIR